MADPGFPIGGREPRKGGRGLPTPLCFENFVCQNERIWTLRGGGHVLGTLLDPPMKCLIVTNMQFTTYNFPNCLKCTGCSKCYFFLTLNIDTPAIAIPELENTRLYHFEHTRWQGVSVNLIHSN